MLNLAALNPQQRLAVETLEGPVLILAGAGTGKTRVITSRVANLIGHGVLPGNILAVTFTNKAAREMQSRVSELLPRRRKGPDGEKPERATICTFHSLGVRILRQHIERLGYKRNFVIYSESDQLGAVKKILSRISAKGEAVDASAVLAALSKIKNAGSRAPALTESGMMLAHHIRTKYESALRACNAVDFDDLILLTLKLLSDFPEVVAACRDKYRYVMVDEYQDTNASQFDLVRLLAGSTANLCVVGDDDQSIYGWRGAEIANLLELEKHFPKVKVVKLEQNYRSTTTILQAANAVIKNNARRRAKQLWSKKGTGEKIVLHTFADDEEEARVIVEQIEYGRLTAKAPWSSQAILFRTNIQSRSVETALRKAGVRYHLIGGQSYFDRREVKDLLSYLKTFANPNDDISLLRIANVPARGLTDVTMERLLAASQERQCPVFEVMKNPLVTTTFPTRTRESIEAFVELIERNREPLFSGHSLGMQTWADRFLEETGYLADLRRSEKDAEVAENRVRNVKQIAMDLGGGEEIVAKPAERLELFLEDVTLDRDRKEEEEDAGDAVTLITMHSCKGLEFPHVYIVGLEEGLLPHSRSKVEGTLDEERRLFYVALTRAMETLTLSYCQGRKKYGVSSPCHPSQFLKELPQDLVELADEKAKQPVAAESGKVRFDMLRAALDL